jgi:hypothetical protein
MNSLRPNFHGVCERIYSSGPGVCGPQPRAVSLVQMHWDLFFGPSLFGLSLRAVGWEMIIPDQLPGILLVSLACIGAAWIVLARMERTGPFVSRAGFYNINVPSDDQVAADHHRTRRELRDDISEFARIALGHSNHTMTWITLDREFRVRSAPSRSAWRPRRGWSDRRLRLQSPG